MLITENVVQHSSASPVPFRSLLNPVRMLRNLWAHHELTLQLAKREFLSRYKNANLGVLWSILTPVVMLAIFTFVFSVVFKARWGDGVGEANHFEFALYLFCGLLLYNFFSETISRAPNLVLANPNYVTKIVFPLEVLAISVLLASLLVMLIGYIAWLGFFLLVRQSLPPVTILLMPVVMLPVCLMTAGLSWFCAAVGVFVRDISHAVLLILQALFYLSPVIYRVEMVDPPFRYGLYANPLTYVLEWTRGTMIDARPVNWLIWAALTAGSFVVALVGYAFFMKSKRAFGDVV
ncbi:MAG: ABC transporter permease [Phycisphaerae bacterium]|nr:ABC transporter permease [Phycisphaerae bacterium]